jgi:hypothetical protein
MVYSLVTEEYFEPRKLKNYLHDGGTIPGK